MKITRSAWARAGDPPREIAVLLKFRQADPLFSLLLDLAHGQATPFVRELVRLGAAVHSAGLTAADLQGIVKQQGNALANPVEEQRQLPSAHTVSDPSGRALTREEAANLKTLVAQF